MCWCLIFHVLFFWCLLFEVTIFPNLMNPSWFQINDQHVPHFKNVRVQDSERGKIDTVVHSAFNLR